MDKILLTGVHFEVHAGVPEDERAVPQTVIVDVECERDLRPAGLTDDFAKTTDYAAVHRTLRDAATSRPYALIETLAEVMAAAVLAQFDVESVRVLIRKPAALQAKRVDWAGVEIVRRRRG
ncbi:MAG: dihydroneopterin aldolase [Candidatus Solibacter usitatus]|nr:dihydroneopterin aldolase [Candidatus Solibacter usitatus]